MSEFNKIKKRQAKTKFEYWVYSFGGAIAVSKALGVTNPTIFNWLNRKTQPNIVYIIKILKLAPELTVHDIAKGTLP